MQFVAPFEELSVCSFLLTSVLLAPNAEPSVTSAVAKTQADVPAAMVRALLGFPDEAAIEDIHREAFEKFTSKFNRAEDWKRSPVTGLPVICSGSFDDISARIVITLSIQPIIDLDSTQTMIDPTLVGMGVADQLLEGSMRKAESEYTVPFLGTATPDTWSKIIDATLGDDRNTLVRLVPYGVFGELASDVKLAITDPDDIISAEFCFHLVPGSDEENDVIRYFDEFKEVGIRRMPGNTTVINITGAKGRIMTVLDWCYESLTAIKTRGIEQE